MALQVHIVDMLHVNDNYNFILHDDVAGFTAVIDPSEEAGVVAALEEYGLTLDRILVTHSHWDHVGGIKKLVERYSCYVVAYAPDAHRIPCASVLVEEGDMVSVGNHTAKIIYTPGHLDGHIAYHFADDKLLFAGDVLFRMGCGRVFEGTTEDLYNSFQKLAALPEDTIVYTAHEYTLANARFARSVEPENEAREEQVKAAKALRKQGLPTIFTTIGQEKAANPFMRAKSAEEFAELRANKDVF